MHRRSRSTSSSRTRRRRCRAPRPIGATCAVTLQHSCASTTDDQLFGDPAVRIDAVISAAAQNEQTSICDDSYLVGLQSLEQLIATAAATPRT